MNPGERSPKQVRREAMAGMRVEEWEQNLNAFRKDVDESRAGLAEAEAALAEAEREHEKITALKPDVSEEEEQGPFEQGLLLLIEEERRSVQSLRAVHAKLEAILRGLESGYEIMKAEYERARDAKDADA